VALAVALFSGRRPCRYRDISRKTEIPVGIPVPVERFAGAPVTAPGAARLRNRASERDNRESLSRTADGEFMAVRFRPKQAVGAVGAGVFKRSDGRLP